MGEGPTLTPQCLSSTAGSEDRGMAESSLRGAEWGKQPTLPHPPSLSCVVNTVATVQFIFLLLLCADNSQLCDVSDSPLASGGRSKAAAACRHMENLLGKVRIRGIELN